MVGIITLPRTTRRRLALGTSMAFVGALLLAQAHQVIAHHAYCSDHGELIHLQRPPGDLQKIPGAGQARLHNEHKVEGIHGCLALTFITSPWLQPPPGGFNARSVTVQDASPTPGSTPHPTIPRLHQAPKQSPPRA